MFETILGITCVTFIFLYGIIVYRKEIFKIIKKTLGI